MSGSPILQNGRIVGAVPPEQPDTGGIFNRQSAADGHRTFVDPSAGILPPVSVDFFMRLELRQNLFPLPFSGEKAGKPAGCSYFDGNHFSLRPSGGLAAMPFTGYTGNVLV